MKNFLSIAAISTLFLSAAFIYSCQKEKVNAVPQTLTDAQQNVSIDRSGTCSSITVGRGVGLVICGTDSGTIYCTVCGVSGNGELIDTSPDFFGISGSSVFSLYNPTSQSITAALTFNCALQAPYWVTVAPLATKSFSVAPNGQGCCVPTPCY